MYRLNIAIVLAVLAALLVSCDNDTPRVPEGGIPDEFAGMARTLVTGEETGDFPASEFVLKIEASDGSIITRDGSHVRNGGRSVFEFTSGLADGEYRFLYFEYPSCRHPRGKDLAAKWDKAYYGLGARVRVDGNSIEVVDKWDSRIGLYGDGSADNPYIIAWGDHLAKLAHYVNSDLTNSNISADTHFLQVADIDMDQTSFLTDMRYGWEPVGNDTNHPFRGVYSGKGISNLWSLRPSSPGIGMFGYIQNASIDGIGLSNADIEANFASSALVGAIITAGNARDRSSITNCTVRNSSVHGSDGSVAIGGLLGAVDSRASALIHGCSNFDSDVSGSYNAGGIVGSASIYSLSSITNCTNSGSIESRGSGAGGIIGTADTLYVSGCENRGLVRGGTASDNSVIPVGAGGLCGGSGVSFFTGCVNSGDVAGIEGVGGILGSTRIKGSPDDSYVYNNTLMRYCKNSGNISGDNFVAGICGEGQFGCYGALNQGSVTGTSYVGGIAGNTSIAVAHNSLNTGDIGGADYVSGIVGKTSFGSIALDHNYGRVTGTGSHTAGILGLAGNNTIIHYCGNFGDITNLGGSYVGGLVGEIGDPRRWTGMNIAECVVGSLEIVMSMAGPCIAVVEHIVGGVCHAAGMIIKVTEFAFDVLLNATDAVLWSIGLYELACPESMEEVENAVNAMADETGRGIAAEMAAIRQTEGNYKPYGMSGRPISAFNMTSFSDLQAWYEADGNDEEFNEAVNETRAERMEELEKSHHLDEIIHQAVGGVCFVVGTVAAIGGVVASGGAATAFVLAGSAAAVAGGLNAITKSVGDFEANAVVVSQCVNTGAIEAGGSNAGGLVGRLQDASILRDCLNVGRAKGTLKPFTGSYGANASIQACLCASEGWEDQYELGKDGYAVTFKNGSETRHDNLLYFDKNDFNNPELYKKYFPQWDISAQSSSIWRTTDNGAAGMYPVPAYSEMRNR